MSSKLRAVFTGWTCVSGPASLVEYLVRNGEAVSYQTFVRNVDVFTLDLEPWQRKLLRTDWSVTFLRTRLPSGAPAWVMQHSHVEHLCLDPMIRFDSEVEGRLAEKMGY